MFYCSINLLSFYRRLLEHSFHLVEVVDHSGVVHLVLLGSDLVDFQLSPDRLFLPNFIICSLLLIVDLFLKRFTYLVVISDFPQRLFCIPERFKCVFCFAFLIVLFSFQKFVFNNDGVKLIWLNHDYIEECNAYSDQRAEKRNLYSDVGVRYFVVDPNQEIQMDSCLRSVKCEEHPHRPNFGCNEVISAQFFEIIDAERIQND